MEEHVDARRGALFAALQTSCEKAIAGIVNRPQNEKPLPRA